MSRPFSYNDENFTVIGNMLFVHFIDNNARKANELVLKVPPALLERLLVRSNSTLISVNNSLASTSRVGIGINDDGYIYFPVDRTLSLNDRMYYCFYYLKDI